MNLATTTVCINATFPVKQYGHLSQTNLIEKVNDDLQARIVSLESDEIVWIHISCDIIGFNQLFQENLKNTLTPNFDKPLFITTSATHTHHACNPYDEQYQKDLFNILKAAISNLEYKKLNNPTVSFQTVPFDQVGKSRISNHEATVLLSLLIIKENNNPLVNFVIHNVHPTILEANTPFFSAEYPGLTLRKLTQANPEQFFTFIQGAAGDISTRFTRDGQDYEAVKVLAQRLVDKITQMKREDIKDYPLTLDYQETLMPLEHELDPIDLSSIPENLTQRELETIAIGQKVRENIKNMPGKLAKDCLVSRIKLGDFAIVFTPHELFSYYLKTIDTTKSILGCYSNGYTNYVTGLDFQALTYESFTDTLSLSTKKALIEQIVTYSK